MMANLVDFGFRTNQVLVQECLAEQEPWETSPADEGFERADDRRFISGIVYCVQFRSMNRARVG
jgi:hypothetical protein